MTNFAEALFAEIKKRVENEEYRYTDNSFEYLCKRDESAMERDKHSLETQKIPPLEYILSHHKEKISREITRNSGLFDILGDAYSRNTMITRSAYAVLGHLLVKFPFLCDGYLQKLDDICDKTRVPGRGDFTANEFINEFGFSEPIARYDLAKAGIDFQCHTVKNMVYTFVYDNMYRYDHEGTEFDIAEGDYVFDCGAAFCDTALHFALKAGKDGRIFSYDPNPFMHYAGRYNIDLNPHLKDRIQVASLGISSRATENVKLYMGGEGSSLTPNKNLVMPTTDIATTSIDLEVARHAIPKVDFIKMDIEGAELEALAGAVKTITRFRPKLAISVYHKAQDMFTIPRFIQELDLGYAFYLKHHSPVIFETVLYAKPA